MAILPEKPHTERNRFTRMCIGDALLSLLAEKPLEKISVSDIVKKAGISRMTYYYYYHSKTEVIENYMEEIVARYVTECKVHMPLYHYEQVLEALLFFDHYAPFLTGLADAGYYSLMINAINRFLQERILPHYEGSAYELYYSAGALLNTFILWEQQGKKESAEEIAALITQKSRTTIR